MMMILQQIKNMLIPRKIVVSAIEKKTELEKAWFINKLDRIVISHEGVRQPKKQTKNEQALEEMKSEKVEDSTSYVSKAASAIKSAVSKVHDYVADAID